MSAVQLNFNLNTSPNVKTVHLLGSWDGYHGQLPLSKSSGGKHAAWKGAFRFQLSMVKPGQRYWYYYMLDGYHVSHDPAAEFTVEPTTKRKLNILDVPGSVGMNQAASHSRHTSQDIPVGRGLSPSRIQHPKPSKPYASQRFCQSGFGDHSVMRSLNARFERADLSDSDSDILSSSPSSLDDNSSRGNSTSPSSMSSLSDIETPCTCEMYGVTKAGDRVRLHCGGRRCGGASPDLSSDSDPCSSDSEDELRQARQLYSRRPIRVRR